MVKIYPGIRANQPSIIDVWRNQDVDCIVIPIQDLISPKTLKPNKTFYQIKKKGGIHNFLKCSKEIILSFVMKDELIHKFSVRKYAYIINTLKPDYYTTPDGWTYEGEEKISAEQIKRCFIETVELIPLCLYSKPIGHIKGCNKKQILSHIKLLKSLGITKFLFHIGDFFRHADENSIAQAKNYAVFIRKHVKTLMLYGMGSQKRLTEFSFADAYITFNHLVKALYGQKYQGTNIIKYPERYSPKIVKHNLLEIIKNVNKIKSQTKLIIGGVCPWEEEVEAHDLILGAEMSQSIIAH